jgi:DNA polymerase III epsilon subunit-like protein
MDRVYLDLETTLLDEQGSIVEIAAKYYRDGKYVSGFSGKCFASDAKISLDALKVNGHTFASLNSLRSEKDILLSLFDWILKLEGKPDLAGINIHFDFHFLKNRAKLYNVEVGSVLPYRLHDITNISRFLQTIGLLQVKRSGAGNSLRDLADTLGITYNEKDLHTADGDVSLYQAIDSKLEELAKQAMCKCKV